MGWRRAVRAAAAGAVALVVAAAVAGAVALVVAAAAAGAVALVVAAAVAGGAAAAGDAAPARGEGAPRGAAAAGSPSFTAPTQLATAQYGLAAAVATDAAGTTTAVITGDGAPKLLERAASAPWPAPARLPGDPRGMKGPVLAAAGQGALAIAWRVDTPRKYSGIQAALRDPGGALSTPIEIAGQDAGGVRHPALAIDPDGDALLAFNADTRKVHLSLKGAIAVSYRPAGGSFAEPTILDDTPSSAPAVALAPDGTGIVAWAHNRRVYAVSVADGQLGKVKEVAASRGLRNVYAAAGPGGQATIAWVGWRDRTRRYEIRALRRPAGGAFTTTRSSQAPDRSCASSPSPPTRPAAPLRHGSTTTSRTAGSSPTSASRRPRPATASARHASWRSAARPTAGSPPSPPPTAASRWRGARSPTSSTSSSGRPSGPPARCPRHRPSAPPRSPSPSPRSRTR
jgi:hypothetical protein